MVENTEIIESKPTYNPNYTTQIQQRPMFLPRMMMQQMPQSNQMPFPLVFFLFPRVALFMMTMVGGMSYQNQRGIGLKTVTQLIRDEKGRIIEILEIIK